MRRQLKTALTGSYLSTAEAFIWPLVLTWTSGISDTVTVGKPTGHWLSMQMLQTVQTLALAYTINVIIQATADRHSPRNGYSVIIYTCMLLLFLLYTKRRHFVILFHTKTAYNVQFTIFTHLHIVPNPYDFLSSSKGQIELHDFSLRECCQAQNKNKNTKSTIILSYNYHSGISFDLH